MAPQNQTIKLGTAFVLECDADGNPLPNITWFFNGHPLQTSVDLLLENENTELVVSVAKEQHAGKYAIEFAKCVSKRNRCNEYNLLNISYEKTIYFNKKKAKFSFKRTHIISILS